MFTGIVEEVGHIKTLQSGRLTIAAKGILKGTKPGDSINVNGACLTVTAIDGNTFSIDVMPETLRRTSLGALRPGEAVNLERALPADGRFGGHFVQGHVDGTGKISSVFPEGEALLMKIAAPPDIMRYTVEKGFIAVDGVSLTVIGCDADSFSISLVAFTRQHTTLGHKKPADAVNLEVDIIAKYVERLRGEGKPGVSLEFLGKHGFLAT
jgi:riboflavin synthase